MARSVPPAADSVFAMAIASGRGVIEAAEASSISRRTASRRLAEPDFRRQVADLRSEMLGQAVGRMAAAATEAVDTLVELARSAQGETARLNAARAVLELGVKFRESLELENRIAELEQRAGVTAEGTRR